MSRGGPQKNGSFTGMAVRTSSITLDLGGGGGFGYGREVL